MTQVRPSPADVHQVKQALASGRWIKSRYLVSLGIEKRKIRAVAQATGDVISGQQGYKLTSCASHQEIETAVADLRSRSNQIAARATRLESRHLSIDAMTSDLFI